MTSAAPRPTGPLPIDPSYDASGEAKRLLRATRSGSLATLALNGHPFVSLVNIATDHDGAPILLTSQLSLHTRYLMADPRASVLLAQGGKGDPLAHPRLTVLGRAKRAEDETHERLRRRFLARHPKSALYVDFPDFAFWRLEITGAHINGGFARAADFDAEGVVTDLTGSERLIAAEEDALAHLNEDHAETLRLYATRLAGEPDGAWRAVGLDPEGLDLARGELCARVVFPRKVLEPGALRAVLAELARAARGGEVPQG